MNNPYQGKPEYYDPGPCFMACPLCSRSRSEGLPCDNDCDLCEEGFVDCHPGATPEEILEEYRARKAEEVTS